MTDLIIAKVTGSVAASSAVAGVVLALTDAVAISAITSAAAVVMAAVSAYFAYRAKMTAEGTHKAVNSRLDEFMKMAKDKYFEDGKREAGRESKVVADAVEKARIDAKPKIVESTEGSVKVLSETVTTTKIVPTTETTKVEPTKET